MWYFCDLLFIFSLIFIVINHITSLNRQTCFVLVFFNAFFKVYPIIFGWSNQIIFKKQKFSLMVLLSFCLIFCPFQPAVAYKSVPYKKEGVYIFSVITMCFFPLLKIRWLDLIVPRKKEKYFLYSFRLSKIK